MLKRHIVAIFACALVLSGCSYFRDEEYIEVEKPADNVQGIDMTTGQMIAGPDTNDLIGIAGRVAAPGVEIYSLEEPAPDLRGGQPYQETSPVYNAPSQPVAVRNSASVEVFPLGGRAYAPAQPALNPPRGAQLLNAPQPLEENDRPKPVTVRGPMDDDFQPVPIQENFDK